jgi:hypothetical protein
MKLPVFTNRPNTKSEHKQATIISAMLPTTVPHAFPGPEKIGLTSSVIDSTHVLKEKIQT